MEIQTRESESLESAIGGQVKMMLSELYMNLHRLNDFGDKMRDQEIYLIALHGSRLHILRAWIPGLKSSALWSQKCDLVIRRGVYPEHTPATLIDQSARAAAYKQAVKCTMKEILTDLGGEARVDTFRVVASKEYDLWIKHDFEEAMKAVIALFTYLMSGQAKMGILQDAFRLDNHDYDSSDEDVTAMNSEEDEQQDAETTVTAQGTSLSRSPRNVQPPPSHETPRFSTPSLPPDALNTSHEPGLRSSDVDYNNNAEAAYSNEAGDEDNILDSHWLSDIMREINPNDVEDESNFRLD